MVCYDLGALPVHVQRSRQSGSTIMEATHSTVWWVMSECWHYTHSRSEESQQGWLEATDLLSVSMRVGDIQSEPKVSNLSPGWQRSKRGNPVSQLPVRDERAGVDFSGGKPCQSNWLVQRNSVYFYLGIKYTLWGIYSFFFCSLDSSL